MKLISLRIENFKCIEDSAEFTIDQVTSLVGKNEAGKTAILEALYKLNPVETDKKDFDELEYPRRHVTTYRQRQDKLPVNVITTIWQLEPEDLDFMEELLGPDVIENPEVTITKGYENTRNWTVEVNEKKFLKNFIGGYRLDAAEKSQLHQPETVNSLIETLNKIESPTQKQQELLEALKTQFGDASFRTFVYTRLASRLPHFVYFDVYHKLPGRVALTDLKERMESNISFGEKIFLALLDMTSSSLEEIEQIGESEKLIMELEAIENSLTDHIFEYWSQNRYLDVTFRFDAAQPQDPPPFNEGFIFNTRIRNRRHRATVNFEERSSGFIWFFSFLVWFSQVKKNYGSNLFILLDEPGLSLHGKAQKDLLRYVNEKLRPDYQVIYTTHSPFMIDIDHIFSLRTVEDVVELHEKDGETVEQILGTKVGHRILSRNEDTLFPLQGIVGFDIAQTMFVGPYVVVVEGPTESALIHWFSRRLTTLGRTNLDIRWAVCPADGASKVSSFVTLFHGRGLKIAALMDYHDRQKRTVDQLEKSGLLEEDHLLKTKSYVNQNEADIEDLVGRTMYVHLVNGALNLLDHLKMSDEKPDDAEERLVKEAEAHCQLLPPGIPEFNHYLPVQYLMEQTENEISEMPGLDEALDTFEKLFGDLNKLI